MTLMNLRSWPSIILFQLASPAKHGFPAQICLAEGRVSLIHFPPNASFPALAPLYPAPFSAMSFPWMPGSSSCSHQMLRQVDQNPNPNYSVLHEQAANWKRTQSGFLKRLSVHESPLSSSITLRSGCLLSVSSHVKWGQIIILLNRPPSLGCLSIK